MKKAQLALLAASVLAAGTMTFPALGDSAPVTTNGCITSVPDPTTPTTPQKICYSLFKPAGADATHQVPMIFHSHGWGGSRTTTASSFTGWLDAGFGVLSFDQRGFGESGGIARIENPDFEGKDVQALAAMVANLDWVQKDAPGDPRLGAIGGSYGGGYQFVGAFSAMADRADGKPLFDALAPEITWNDLRDSLAPNKVARSEWDLALTAAGVRSLPQEILEGLAYNVATGDWPQGQGGVVPDFDAFFAKNGPAYHVAQGRKLDIPVMFGQGITDNLFPLTQGLKNYLTALTPAAQDESVFIGYNSGHVLPQALPLDTTASGDPCSQAIFHKSFGDASIEFMKKYLKGDTGTIIPDHFTGFHLANAANGCTTVQSVAPNTDFAAGTVATTSGAAGAPVAYELASGPFTVAGMNSVTADVTALGATARGFFALGVGTTVADAKMIQGNVMPLSMSLTPSAVHTTFELPSVAFDVPAGQKLFLIASPFNDMFFSNTGRAPGALLLQNTVVHVSKH